MMKEVDCDFENWNPKKYLKDYFSDNPEFESTIKFILELSEKIPKGSEVIDIGCGPTACYWSALTKNAARILLADYKI